MRRLILVAVGVMLGFMAAATVLVLGLLGESLAVPARTSLMLFEVAALILAGLQDGAAAQAVSSGASAVWLAFVATCFVPVALVATVGEAIRRRGLVWAAGGTGLVTAAVPAAVAALAAHGTPPEAAGLGRFTILLFLTGVAAGAVLWAVSGRVARTTRL